MPRTHHLFAEIFKQKWQDEADEAIEFSSDRLLVGIVFHLLDDGLAMTVDKVSAWEAADRLARECARGRVRRWSWRSMTNAQRLAWLLTRAQTTVTIDANGTATLRPILPGWPRLLIIRCPHSGQRA